MISAEAPVLFAKVCAHLDSLSTCTCTPLLHVQPLLRLAAGEKCPSHPPIGHRSADNTVLGHAAACPRLPTYPHPAAADPSCPAPHHPPQACELFILDLTIRGWVHAEDSRRRTLQRSDIAASIAHWEVLDFLVRTPQIVTGLGVSLAVRKAAAAAGKGNADCVCLQRVHCKSAASILLSGWLPATAHTGLALLTDCDVLCCALCWGPAE